MQNRCKLFKAVQETLPDEKQDKHVKLPWSNSKYCRKIDTIKLMKDVDIKSPDLVKSPTINEEGEQDESIEQTIRMPFRYQF